MGIFSRKTKKEERSFFPETQANAFSPSLFVSELNPTVRACVDKIASTISTLPIHLFVHTKGGGRTYAINNPAFRVLENPSFEESPTLFWHTLVSQMLLEGNAYCFINRGKSGDIIGLTIIDPKMVRVSRSEDFHKLFNVNGTVYTSRDILHIPYFEGYNGTRGFSPAELNKDLVNLDNELLAYIHTYFELSPGKRLAFKMDKELINGKLTEIEKAYAATLPWIAKFVNSPMNAGKPMMMPPGMDAVNIDQTSNIQSDLKSLLTMVEKHIAQSFGVPYEIIDSEASKYSSLEQKQQDFLLSTIKPLCDHICGALLKQLCDPDDTALFIEFNYKEMLKPSTETLISTLSKEVQSGILTLNEARAKLGESPIEDPNIGDIYFVPSNLAPLTHDYSDAYMADSKAKASESHNPNGDDKK